MHGRERFAKSDPDQVICIARYGTMRGGPTNTDDSCTLMRLNRIFSASRLQSGTKVALPPSAANHVARVLRLRAGASLTVFDGTGGEYRAEIASVVDGDVVVSVGEHVQGTPESPLRITITQGIPRSERMDWALQKATELGVAVIAPVIASRSVVRLDEAQGAKKVEHWRSIVIGACEQSGRNRVPQVLAPRTLREHFAKHPKEGLRLVLSPTAPGSLAGLTSMPAKVELLIGPEGGLDDDELAQAQNAGYVPVRLGPRVLRTETAAVTALSVLQAMWGDLV
jgi:16S rRNA (uracil1498-N3)-methyltransferase